MLQRDLKKIANESVFNPKNTSMSNQVLLQVGNPLYWTTKAVELIMATNALRIGSTAYNNNLKEAIKLLLITRVETNEIKESKETRNNTSSQDFKTLKG